jgi:hypothetical protein
MARMNKPFVVLAISAWLVCACAVDRAAATAVHAYKKNEYPVIVAGAAPSQLYSITSHGGGELGDVDFHLYLTAEPAHKIIAKLPSIGTHDILDSAPGAFYAVWSADSRHVAVQFRGGRHVDALRLYEIRDRQPRLLSGPGLLATVVKNAAISAGDYEVRSSLIALTWLSPASFMLEERDLLFSGSPELGRKLAAFGRQNAEAEEAEPGRYFVNFSAQAVGELIAGGKYRITELEPGLFD